MRINTSLCARVLLEQGSYLCVHLATSQSKSRQTHESKFSQKLPRLKPLRGSGVRRAPQILLFFLKAPLSKAFVKTREKRNKFIQDANKRRSFTALE